VVKYLVDYYKASDAYSVMSRVDGQSITFGLRSGTIRVSKSTGHGTTISITQPDDEAQEESMALDRSSSSDSLPTLSRRHSTTSFQQNPPSTPEPPPASQSLAPSNSLRRLSHSVSERDLRKRSDSLVSDTDAPPKQESYKETTSPGAQSLSGSVLSPHAAPFAVSPEEPSNRVVSVKSHSQPGAAYPQHNSSAQHTSYVQNSAYPDVAPDHTANNIYGGVYYAQTPYPVHHHGHPAHLGSPIPLHSPPSNSGLGLNMHHMYYVGSHHHHHGQQSSFGSPVEQPHVPPHLVIGQGVLGSSMPPPMLSYPQDPSTPRSAGSGRSSMESPTAYSPSSMQLHGVPPRNTLDLDKIQRGEDTRTVCMTPIVLFEPIFFWADGHAEEYPQQDERQRSRRIYQQCCASAD
jgi:hypothetical protein